jgi:ribose transport system substrate-binding protein
MKHSWKLHRFGVALAAVGLVAVACGPIAESSGVASASSQKIVKIALVTGHADGYYQAVVCGVRNEAKILHAKVVSAQGPQTFSAAAQVPLIDAAIALKPQALIVVPTDVNALNPTLNQIRASGIKIVTTDTAVAPSAAKKFVSAQVLTDNAIGGIAAARALGKAMNGTGTVLVINVAPGIASTDARLAGFVSEMGSAYPSIKILPAQYDDNAPATASSLVTAAFASNTSISGVYATNDNSVEGVVNGMQAAGKAGTVPLVGWDGLAVEISELNAGYINTLILSNPEAEGSLAARQAILAVRGDKVSFNVKSPLTVVTKSNVNSKAAAPAIKSYSLSATSAC